MEHKSFKSMTCPIALSLDRVGEWWSILIIREAFYGAKKFDDFQKGLADIAPNTLTRRLRRLVDAGIFERHRYSDGPARYEYVLTQCGRDFYPVLWSLAIWGNKHLSAKGDIISLENLKTKKKAVPFLADKITGKEMLPSDYKVVAGPAADNELRRKIATLDRSIKSAMEGGKSISGR